jgi:hypothetical protein
MLHAERIENPGLQEVGNLGRVDGWSREFPRKDSLTREFFSVQQSNCAPDFHAISIGSS